MLDWLVCAGCVFEAEGERDEPSTLAAPARRYEAWTPCERHAKRATRPKRETSAFAFFMALSGMACQRRDGVLEVVLVPGQKSANAVVFFFFFFVFGTASR